MKALESASKTLDADINRLSALAQEDARGALHLLGQLSDLALGEEDPEYVARALTGRRPTRSLRPNAENSVLIARVLEAGLNIAADVYHASAAEQNGVLPVAFFSMLFELARGNRELDARICDKAHELAPVLISYSPRAADKIRARCEKAHSREATIDYAANPVKAGTRTTVPRP